jgi:hypothetical protein
LQLFALGQRLFPQIMHKTILVAVGGKPLPSHAACKQLLHSQSVFIVIKISSSAMMIDEAATKTKSF